MRRSYRSRGLTLSDLLRVPEERRTSSPEQRRLRAYNRLIPTMESRTNDFRCEADYSGEAENIRKIIFNIYNKFPGRV